MPYSSTVRSRTVVRRQCATSRFDSYTPRTVFVFPTSITRSMADPPLCGYSGGVFDRPPRERRSGPQRLYNFSERHAHGAAVRQPQQEGPLLIDARDLPFQATRGPLDDDGTPARQGGEGLPLTKHL